MIRVIAFSIGFIAQIIEVGFSILGMIAALIGAGVALVLCIVIIGGLMAIFSFFLALLG